MYDSLNNDTSSLGNLTNYNEDKANKWIKPNEKDIIVDFIKMNIIPFFESLTWTLNNPKLIFNDKTIRKFIQSLKWDIEIIEYCLTVRCSFSSILRLPPLTLDHSSSEKSKTLMLAEYQSLTSILQHLL